jgi:hypothetical protein
VNDQVGNYLNVDTFEAPRHARGLFEALCTDNLDIGRLEEMQIIFGRRVATSPPGVTAPSVAHRG